MQEFVAADILLFIRSEVMQPQTADRVFWFPQSAPFVQHRLPSYLVKGESSAYALGLLKAFGVQTLGTLRAAYAAQSPQWGQFFRAMGTPPLTVLRLDKIGTRP
jgi:hypothetical protein